MRSAFVVVMLSACGGDGGIAIEFANPAPSAHFARDGLGPTGALSALVPVELDIDGAPTRISLSAGARALADVVDGVGTADIRTPGAVTLTANAYDGEAIVATATVDIIVDDLSLATCQERLDLYRIDYVVGPAAQGIVDPVTAKM